jgi:hypothetical protein
MGMARTSRGLYLRVILLPDGETLFNALPDSNFIHAQARTAMTIEYFPESDTLSITFREAPSDDR